MLKQDHLICNDIKFKLYDVNLTNLTLNVKPLPSYSSIEIARLNKHAFVFTMWKAVVAPVSSFIDTRCCSSNQALLNLPFGQGNFETTTSYPPLLDRLAANMVPRLAMGR